MAETVQVDKEQLTELLRQNKKMKELIRTANGMFKNVSMILDLKQGADLGNMMLKVPKVLKEVKRNPQMFEGLPQMVKDMEEFL